MKNKSGDDMSDKNRLLKHVESCSDFSSDVDIIKMYVESFPASKLSNFINDLQNTLDYKICSLEHANYIAKERAIYLRTYLEGNMYTTKEAAIQHIPVQIKNAQRIIDVCNGKERFDW